MAESSTNARVTIESEYKPGTGTVIVKLRERGAWVIRQCAAVAFLAMLLLLPLNASAKNLYKERHYQDIWCEEQRGICEVVLPDRTRCDCVTDNYAVEFGFGKKWTEAIGQSLYYALQTGKKAGIVLILNHQTINIGSGLTQ